MPLSDYAANKLLDHMFNDAAYSAPTPYVALSTTTPTTAGANVTEPSGNNYSRTQVTTAAMSAAASRSKTNGSDINLPTPSGSWGTITHLVFYDAASGGNMLFFIDCPDRTVTTGDSPKIIAGALVVGL